MGTEGDMLKRDMSMSRLRPPWSHYHLPLTVHAFQRPWIGTDKRDMSMSRLRPHGPHYDLANSCETVPEIRREDRHEIMWGTIYNRPISLALEQMKCRVSFQEPDH
jgi:hypothetical protein